MLALACDDRCLTNPCLEDESLDERGCELFAALVGRSPHGRFMPGQPSMQIAAHTTHNNTHTDAAKDRSRRPKPRCCTSMPSPLGPVGRSRPVTAAWISAGICHGRWTDTSGEWSASSTCHGVACLLLDDSPVSGSNGEDPYRASWMGVGQCPTFNEAKLGPEHPPLSITQTGC